MSKLFYISEVIKFAIEKEQESFALYQKLAGVANNPDSKKLFETLMKEEKKHEEFYAHMLSTVAVEQTPTVKEDDEYLAYMQELIANSRKICTCSESDFSVTAKAVDCAMDRERDSIIFYTGLKGYVPNADQNKIDTIIREEARHLALLANFKKHM